MFVRLYQKRVFYNGPGVIPTTECGILGLRWEDKNGNHSFEVQELRWAREESNFRDIDSKIGSLLSRRAQAVCFWLNINNDDDIWMYSLDLGGGPGHTTYRDAELAHFTNPPVNLFVDLFERAQLHPAWSNLFSLYHQGLQTRRSDAQNSLQRWYMMLETLSKDQPGENARQKRISTWKDFGLDILFPKQLCDYTPTDSGLEFDTYITRNLNLQPDTLENPVLNAIRAARNNRQVAHGNAGDPIPDTRLPLTEAKKMGEHLLQTFAYRLAESGEI